MRLLSLTINSFTPLRFGPVTLPLDRQGLVLVEGSNLDSAAWAGSNRAGKSALFEAIPWCWWGKMPRYGDRVLGDQPCHLVHGADVTVEFEVEGEMFRTRRVKLPGKAARLTVEALAGDGQAPGQPGWVPLTGSALHALESDLTPLLGFSYDTFRAALFLQASGFTVTSAGFGGQMALLESVLRFDVLSDAAEVAKDKAARLAADLARAEGELNSLQREIDSAQQQIKSLEALDETVTRSRIVDEAMVLEAKMRKFPANLSDQVAEAEQDAADNREQAKLAAVAAGKAEMAFQGARELAAKKSCPTCAQPLKASYTGPIVADAEGWAKERGAEAKAAQQSEESSHRRLRVLLGNRDAQADVSRLLSGLLRDLKALDERQGKRQSMLDAATKRLNDATCKLGEVFGTVEVLKWESDVARFWQKGFGSDGLKAEILGSAAPVLNANALKFGEILTDGEIIVEFDPLRSKRTEDLIRIKIGGVPVKYETCSSSEKRRVDLIIALSLRALARWRLARPVNVGLADEIFDTLDEQGLQRVSAILQQDTDELSSLFVITHSPQLKALFPGAKVWHVTRQNDEATVHVG